MIKIYLKTMFVDAIFFTTFYFAEIKNNPFAMNTFIGLKVLICCMCVLTILSVLILSTKDKEYLINSPLGKQLAKVNAPYIIYDIFTDGLYAIVFYGMGWYVVGTIYVFSKMGLYSLRKQILEID